MEDIGTLIIYTGLIGLAMVVLGLSECVIEALYERFPSVKRFFDRYYKNFE